MKTELKVRSFLADGTEIFINQKTGMYDPPVSPPLESQTYVLNIINHRRLSEVQKEGRTNEKLSIKNKAMGL